ncbi:ABC transporter ATP-binding protein [Clostridium grantii]|uniref:ATP-binding cassette, subfamily C n=1 Tax=Clostridium grantii DSM 8605 TaxID=1121316 RepID=A0A1M5X624_9CLOT|nr:ABC transporter ATP-binding protein [Clostridium grantii]SHH95277.1 ATP-binding cassette, subfamily C [Clostridium grantii DSM 8605]
MKKILKETKWLLSQVKPVKFNLILIILIGSVSSILNVYRAVVSKSLIDSATLGNKELIIKWIIIFAMLLCSDIAFSTLNSILTTYCSGKISNNTQSTLYQHVTYSEWIEHSKHHSVNLLTKITNDVGTVSSVLTDTLPSMISFFVMLITAFATLLFLEPTMAILSIIIFPVCIFIGKFYGQRQKKVYIDIQDQEVKYRTFIQETLQNITIVKSFTQEKNNMLSLKNLQNKKLKLLLKRSKINAFSNTFIQIGAWGGYFAVFYWGAMNLSKGTDAFGTLTALLQLFGNIQGPFIMFAYSLPQIINSYGATERLMDIEKMTLEDTTIENLFKIDKPMNMEFKNVSFKYKENLPILKNVSFKINQGDIVALVGTSGEGKTTLIRLLLSFIHATDGELLINQNGEKLNVNRDFRHMISYVPQGNTLFSGSIEDNISYGINPVSFSEIYEAAKQACALDFIENLEDKFSSEIGERGVGLSEGQVQRIAIARALIRKKPVLILDEATSALDGDTEMKLLQSIKNLKNKPTCLIITHRPSALDICNKILTLKDGILSVSYNTKVSEEFQESEVAVETV